MLGIGRGGGTEAFLLLLPQGDCGAEPGQETESQEGAQEAED